MPQTPHNHEWRAWSARHREWIVKLPLDERLKIVRRPAFANLTEQDQKAVWTSIPIPEPEADGGSPSSPKAMAQPRPRVRDRRPAAFEPASKHVAPQQAWPEGEQAFAITTGTLRWAVICFVGLAFLYAVLEWT